MGLFSKWLNGDGVLMGDGAMGTMLQAAGLEPGDAPERLNSENPGAVRSVHETYLQAGSDVITTNTFGGNRHRLALHDAEDRVFEWNKAGAAIARLAAGAQNREVIIAGSVGPTGSLLQPVGDLHFDEAKNDFAEQCVALAEGGVDVILIETMSDLEEVRAAVEGARAAGNLPVMCTMTFDTHGRTMMGTSPEDAVRAAVDFGILAFGSNCGNGPDEMEQISEKMLKISPCIPLIIQSNAGIPRMEGEQVVYEADPRRMARHAKRLQELGVRYIGGCCGTTPAHIRAMNQATRSSDEKGAEEGSTRGGKDAS